MIQSSGTTDFMLELSVKLTSITKLFGTELLTSIRTHLGMSAGVILCFDAENHFLSWTCEEGVFPAEAGHPYAAFAGNDVVEHVVFHASKREDLTYFNAIPKVYKSTDIIGPEEYDDSAYVSFLEQHLGMHYSATLAFGIYGYIQMLFFKTRQAGDFTQSELLELENLYVMIASSYINFKRLEQAKIISEMKDQVITSSEKAYFVTDAFGHVLMCNPAAEEALRRAFGGQVRDLSDPSLRQAWLPMVLRDSGNLASSRPAQAAAAGLKFLLHEHRQSYDHGIVENYYLVTIQEHPAEAIDVLTASEQRVAVLLGQGMTYRQIAEELVVSYHTVKKHVENIYSKLGITNRYQLYELIK